MDLELASAVFRCLLPDFVSKVLNFRFETSPGRREARFLNDGTAFDLALDVITPEDEPATVFIEVKYSEAMEGPAARSRERYDEASHQVGLFIDPDAALLRSLALEQLWREHMLAQLAVDAGVTSRAVFVAVGPKMNRRVQAAFRCYANELIPDDDLADERVRFQAITLETVIDTIHEAGAVELARMLWVRYCDFERVFHLAMAEYTQPDLSNGDTTGQITHVSSPTPRAKPFKARNANRGNGNVSDAAMIK
jgi:hypothetical protein